MGVGYFYALTPVYLGNRLQALLGIEQPSAWRTSSPRAACRWVTILDENGHIS
jgi:two-component system capsular synthesis sensor histidine kinase RcsC